MRKRRLFSALFFFLLFIALSSASPSQTGKNEIIKANNEWIYTPKVSYHTQFLKIFGDIATNMESLYASVRDVNSVYDECNQHPEQFNMNKGKRILADSKCMGSCYIERIIIHGTSMNPLIHESDIVGIKHDTDYNLSVGSIVLFNSLGQDSVDGAYSDSILHRIVGTESGRAEIYIVEGEDILPVSEGIKISHESGDNFVTITIPAEINEAIIKISGTEIALKRPFYITKGDNNNEIGNACEVIPASMIKGVLVST